MNNKEELVDNARATHLRMVMDENKKFRLQLQAVRELHNVDEYGCCAHCSEDMCWGCQEWMNCVECDCPCHGKYPCPTIKALDGEQNG